MASFDKNEQRNLQYECKLGQWTKTRADNSDDIADAAENAKAIRQLTQTLLQQKDLKTQEFLKLTQQRALQRRKLENITSTSKVKMTSKYNKQMTSFEEARNQALITKNLLNSRFSSP